MAKNRTAQKNKYQLENYDRINLIVPKGRKDIIKIAAEARGMSLNAYINAAIDILLRTYPPIDPDE